MTPKTLKEWLHHADDEILARFIANHQNLIAQLMQAWQRQLNKEQAAHNLPDDAAITNNSSPLADNPDDMADDATVPRPHEGEDDKQTASETTATASITQETLQTDDEFAPLDPTTPDTAMPLHPATPTPTAAQTPAIHLPPLPNANQGQPYAYTLPADLPITGLTIENADSGLAWDDDTRRIHGIPTVSGNLTIYITLRDNDKEVPIHLNLHINPDPKSLWQNLPSDQDAPFAKPDSAHEEQTTPHGRLIAARQRGRSHAHIGSYCDDDYRLHYHAASGLHLLTVADGAGSAAHSRYGSQLAVAAVKNTIIALLDDTDKPHHRLAHVDPAQREKIAANLISHALHAAHKAHLEAAQQHGLEAKSLSCTLLIGLAVALPDGHALADRAGVSAAELDGETFLLFEGIGFWRELCDQHFPHSQFVVQEDRAVFEQLARSSSLPHFVTDAPSLSAPMPGRTVVPIRDAMAHATFHLLVRDGGRREADEVFDWVRGRRSEPGGTEDRAS